MQRLPPRSTRPDTRFPYTTLVRSNAGVLTAEVETARWFDALLEAGAPPAQASNWVASELFGALNRLGKDIEESPVSPSQAAELLGLVADDTRSEEHQSELQSLMRISYAVFCLKTKIHNNHP